MVRRLRLSAERSSAETNWIHVVLTSSEANRANATTASRRRGVFTVRAPPFGWARRGTILAWPAESCAGAR